MTVPDRSEYDRELRSYVTGLAAALALTAVPFAMVAFLRVPAVIACVVIGGLALVQVVVHFRYFLHVDLSRQKREDLQLILFSALIIAIMAAGTIWIMTSLSLRMS